MGTPVYVRALRGAQAVSTCARVLYVNRMILYVTCTLGFFAILLTATLIYQARLLSRPSQPLTRTSHTHSTLTQCPLHPHTHTHSTLSPSYLQRATPDVPLPYPNTRIPLALTLI